MNTTKNLLSMILKKVFTQSMIVLEVIFTNDYMNHSAFL